MNNNFDLICYNFQKRIVDIFNGQENIPFQLKFYLFKQVWKTIKQTKTEKDYQTRMLVNQKKQILTEQIELPDEFFKQQKNEQ